MPSRRFVVATLFPAFALVLATALVPGLSAAAPPPTTAPAATAPPATAAAATWSPVSEHWFTLEIGGATAGWMREAVVSDGERYRTDSQAVFKVSRGPVELEIAMGSQFVESVAGAPIELHFVQDMSLQSIEQRWTFRDDDIEIVSTQGGREIRRTVPSPAGTWLTPMAVTRYLAERVEAGAEEITYRGLDPQYGAEPVTFRHVRTGREELTVEGRPVPVLVWRVENSVVPTMPSITKVSLDGQLVEESVAAPWGKMVTRRSTKAAALAAAGGPAPELMVSTFVAVERPIPRPFESVTATLRLRTRDGALPDLPSSGHQRFERESAATGRVHVDLAKSPPATAAEIADASLRAASAMADSSDALVRSLARKACRGTGDAPLARARAMRGFVHRYITAKALDTAFATASETARTRTGDCSEHGVLLAAMLRADGIPARVACGLVYADAFAGAEHVFGWHMWTQALIDGRWVDLDATLPVPYHAAHVLTGTSSLADGLGSGDLTSIVTLVGNLEIEVVEVGYE